MLPPRPDLSHLGGAHPSLQWQCPWSLHTWRTQYNSQVRPVIMGLEFVFIKMLPHPSAVAGGLGITVQVGPQIRGILTLKVHAGLRENTNYNVLVQQNESLGVIVSTPTLLFCTGTSTV